ncbi:hypothetical protein [Labrys sp. WJW]|uniref:hypothetical protein n=1 Tax=Labrys sp. WJW TaxID=1737983 RepID=UPI0012EAE773|nr:hypothetical protein [Labrys sp. WJW]
MGLLGRLFGRKIQKNIEPIVDKTIRIKELSNIIGLYIRKSLKYNDIEIHLSYGAPRIRWKDAEGNGRILYFDDLYDKFTNDPSSIISHIEGQVRCAETISWNDDIISHAFAYVAQNLPENVWRAYIYQESKWQIINYEVSRKIRTLLKQARPGLDLREEAFFYGAFRSYFHCTTLGQRPLAPFQQYRGKFGVVFDQSDIWR